ncbi:unnamed protein product [Caenorhabditis angaria]|uniref:Bardet-Biedl syndrome 2 protein homolog n=1 Tax=Caenorhabditis angaria TaxID=860376 RepID=A0A9P1N4B0_9PELO|nr:unnamed protein product [Caenorhabditis angaria]
MTDGDRTPEEQEISEVPKIDVELEVVASSTFSLNQRILPNCLISAILEPNGRESVLAVSASNKVFVKDTEISLNINEPIRCMTIAPFGAGYDYVVIGTDAHVICFDIHNNQTIFRKEVPDGVNCFAVGKIADNQEAIYCGGNCCIWGFDREGNNIYWTVTGDVVTCMCICDYDSDGEKELIIGSPDFEIRIFKNDLMRTELMETDALISLTCVADEYFAYALANGTIGVYQRDQRLWRIKSKNIVSAVFRFPNDELMTVVWKMGKVDTRLVKNGDVMSKDQTLSGQVQAAAISRNIDEKSQICVALGDGKVQSYHLQKKKDNETEKTQEMIREFGQKKHNLMMELANYEQEEQMTDAEKEREQRIPVDTTVQCAFLIDQKSRLLYLQLDASNEVIIRSVAMFAEGMFEGGESFLWIPRGRDQSDHVLIPLIIEKDSPNDMHVKAFLGTIDSYKLHVYELSRIIPRFARLAFLTDDSVDFVASDCFVEFELKQRSGKLIEWLQDNFIVDANYAIPNIEENVFELRFAGLVPRSDLNVLIRFNKTDSRLTIFCDCVETTGNLIQSIAEYFAILNLESHAIFPALFKEADEIINDIDPMFEVRDRLTAELQEQQTLVKEAMIRAEDNIGINNLLGARKFYIRLKQLDSAARQSANLRFINNERCIKSMRRLLKIIESTSRLRVGEAGRLIVNSCRVAINEDNKQIITKIMEFGAA